MSTKKIVSRIRRGQDALPIPDSALAAGETVPERALGAGIKSALEKQDSKQKALSAAKKTFGRRQSHYFEAVGSAFEAYCPMTNVSMAFLAGLAVTCRGILDDPERCAEIAARGKAEIEKYLVPGEAIFVAAVGLDNELVKKLRVLGLASSPPFLTGKPNIPALLELARPNGLTVFRFDANLDKIVYLKAGAATEHLADLLAEHEALVVREIGSAKADEEQRGREEDGHDEPAAANGDPAPEAGKDNNIGAKGEDESDEGAVDPKGQIEHKPGTKTKGFSRLRHPTATSDASQDLTDTAS